MFALYYNNLFRKQMIMRRVLIALTPIIIFAVYNFGLRVLGLLFLTILSAGVVEYIMAKYRGEKISEAVIVSAILYTLTLPVGTPMWISVVGISFGVLFAKEVFGGFGKNVFNPALVARCFVYIAFPYPLTARWHAPFTGFPGGFVHWINEGVLSSATPLANLRNLGPQSESLRGLFFGQIPGSLGETSALLLILVAVYLIKTKTASWLTMLTSLLSFVATSVLFNILGVSKVIDVIPGLLSGGVLFAIVFMVTDPVTSPSTKEGKIIYGILIGVLTVVIRAFAVFPGGVMFSILIANTFVPALDMMINAWKKGGLKREKADSL